MKNHRVGMAWAWFPVLVLGACASPGFIADATEKVPPVRDTGTPNDVFMRAPWELWRVPNGTARYHRGTHLLLRDEAESFRVTDVSIYAKDGSDVRLDYASVDMGAGSQSRATVSVFVYPAPGTLDQEWQAVTLRMGSQWPAGSAAEPFPVPARHPPDTRQMAVIAPPSGGTTIATYAQTTLFHSGQWAARYEITCAAEDVEVARKTVGAFLRDIRHSP